MLVAPQPLSPKAQVRTARNRAAPMRLNRVPARFHRRTRGNSNVPHSSGGSLRRGGSEAKPAADWEGTEKVSETVFTCVKAGNVHCPGACCSHPGAVSVAVAPAGKSVTVKVVEIGKDVPVLGAMLREYVAEPPGSTVCAPEFPTLKSMRVSDKALLDDPAKLAFPANMALMECWPAVSVEVLNAATPPLSAAEPSGVVPSTKLTVPVGVPAADVTLAEKVIVFWTSPGFASEERLVPDTACAISSVPVAEPE